MREIARGGAARVFLARDAGECASCHVADGWKPSLYTATEHAKLAVSSYNFV